MTTTAITQYHAQGPCLVRFWAVRFAPRPTAAGRKTFCDLAQSGHRGPAGPRITQVVQTGRSHLPQVRFVASLGCR